MNTAHPQDRRVGRRKETRFFRLIHLRSPTEGPAFFGSPSVGSERSGVRLLLPRQTSCRYSSGDGPGGDDAALDQRIAALLVDNRLIGRADTPPTESH